LSLISIMTLYGPQAALIAESFDPRLRYSGAGLGYQLASIIAGGPAPFIAAALFAAYQSGYAIAFYTSAAVSSASSPRCRSRTTRTRISTSTTYVRSDIARQGDRRLTRWRSGRDLNRWSP
jgi:hypothetical protein